MTEFRNADSAVKLAHQNNEIATLAKIYEAHGRSKLGQNDINGGCFYLSNAYVFALEADLESAPRIHKLLVCHGREE